MRKLLLAPAAESDISSILEWSRDNFGESAHRRYALLLVRALADLAEDPTRPGVHDRSDIIAGLRSYHVTHSRARMRPASSRVAGPRHFVLFRVRDETAIEIVRVLHDSMDVNRHLP